MTQDVKGRAVQVIEALLDVSRAEEFLDSLDSEVTWTIPGSWPGISGVKNREQIEKFVRRTYPAGFPGGVTADFRAVHSDGDTAIIEFGGAADTSQQKRYDNSYCLVIEFRGEKVAAIREYMDTLYAHRVLHE